MLAESRPKPSSSASPTTCSSRRWWGCSCPGAFPEGATATDLVLRVVEMLRAHGVVGRFVEYFGPGLSNLTLPDRATLANMGPEYGATIGFFPVDDVTLGFLAGTGPEPGTGGEGGADQQGDGPLPNRSTPRIPSTLRSWNWTWPPSSPAWPDPRGPRTGSP